MGRPGVHRSEGRPSDLCVVSSVVVVSLWTEVGSEANCLGSFVPFEGLAQLPSLSTLATDFLLSR